MVVLSVDGDRAVGGPNLMAIGNYSELPFRRCEGDTEVRYSHNGKELIYSFDDPELDFGRIIVRSSSQALSVVKRDLFVGYTGQGLVVDSRGGGSGGSVTIDELEVWLKIQGKVLPGRSYHWEVEGGAAQEIQGGVPAVVPAIWTDQGLIGTDVVISDRKTIYEERFKDDDSIHRMVYPNGIVRVPEFQRQTGGAWVIIKPANYGGVIGLQRFTFREVDDNTSANYQSAMPVPIRYISIRSQVEGQISEVLQTVPKNLWRYAPEGYWEGQNQEGSIQLTASMVTALAEVDPAAEGIDKALEWLAKQTPPQDQTWSLNTLTARLYALSRFGGLKAYRPVILSDMLAITQLQSEKYGGWGSSNPPASGAAPGTGARNVQALIRPDNEHSFSAMLALREASLAGVEVDNRVWRRALDYWTKAQAYDGGFRDKLDSLGGIGQATTSRFTAMGATALIASLDMAAGFGGKRCNGYLSNKEQLRGINQALEWLNGNYQERFKDLGSLVVAPNPADEAESMQLLGAISGVSHFNGKEHFIEAAKTVMEGFDRASGFFGVRNQYTGAWLENPTLPRTAESIRLLAAGSAPIACQRIVVGDDENHFAEYSSDVDHLVRFLSDERDRKFNWRRTTIERDVHEFAKVPIMIVSIVGPMNWTATEWKKIREYCLGGGSVVFNISEGQESQRDVLLGGLRNTFPEYALADLPDTHKLFSIEKKIETLPKVQALGNGFRDFLFVPADSWSCAWHLFNENQRESSLGFMNNLLTYTTDSTPLSNSFVESTYVEGSSATKTMSADYVEIGGKLSAYPNMVDTMDRLMEANYRVSVDRASDAKNADLLWVGITGDAAPTDEQKAKLGAFLAGGRYLLIDVVSGNKDWDEIFRANLKLIAPSITLEKLRRTDPIYTGEIPGTKGFDVVDVAFRKALHTRLDKRGRCDLYAIRNNGQTVGVYSAYDLSSGMGFNQYPDCRGIMPLDARKIVINMFLDAYARKTNTVAGR